MAFPVRFHEEVQAELDDAVAWYEQQADGLGWRFHSSVINAIEKVAANPTFYGIWFRKYRDVTLNKFPYRIIFKFDNEEIIIMSIFQGNREEVKLLPRLQ